MDHPDVDYNSPDFSRGYEDGYLGHTPDRHGAGSYREGYITGEAERDAPRDCVSAGLYDRRHR